MSNKCPVCDKAIYANDVKIAIKDQTFHKACFRCSVCGVSMTASTYFLVNANKIFCKNHKDTPGVSAPAPAAGFVHSTPSAPARKVPIGTFGSAAKVAPANPKPPSTAPGASNSNPTLVKPATATTTASASSPPSVKPSSPPPVPHRVVPAVAQSKPVARRASTLKPIAPIQPVESKGIKHLLDKKPKKASSQDSDNKENEVPPFIQSSGAWAQVSEASLLTSSEFLDEKLNTTASEEDSSATSDSSSSSTTAKLGDEFVHSLVQKVVKTIISPPEANNVNLKRAQILTNILQGVQANKSSGKSSESQEEVAGLALISNIFASLVSEAATPQSIKQICTLADAFVDSQTTSLIGKASAPLDSILDLLIQLVSNPARSKEQITQIAESLLKLSIVTGSIKGILAVANILDTKQVQINVPSVQQLVNHVPAHQLQSTFNTGAQLGFYSISLASAPLKPVVGPLAKEDDYTSISTDGTYFYIFDPVHGLMKVGTGYFGSQQGHVYARREVDWSLNNRRKRDTVAYNGKLYVLSGDAELTVLNCSDLQDDAVKTIEVGDQSTMKLSAVITSDGKSLYSIRDSNGELIISQFSFPVNNSGYKLVKTVSVPFTPTGGHTAETLVKFASFYTNGQQVVALTHDSPQSFKTFTFNLVTSAFVSVNDSVEGGVLGPAVCYDSVTNLVCSYATYGSLISVWRNASYAVKKDISAPVQITGATVTADKLADILERLVDSEMPAPTEFAPVVSKTLPFIADGSSSVLATLLASLQSAKPLKLAVLLKILRINLLWRVRIGTFAPQKDDQQTFKLVREHLRALASGNDAKASEIVLDALAIGLPVLCGPANERLALLQSVIKTVDAKKSALFLNMVALRHVKESVPVASLLGLNASEVNIEGILDSLLNITEPSVSNFYESVPAVVPVLLGVQRELISSCMQPESVEASLTQYITAIVQKCTSIVEKNVDAGKTSAVCSTLLPVLLSSLLVVVQSSHYSYAVLANILPILVKLGITIDKASQKQVDGKGIPSETSSPVSVVATPHSNTTVTIPGAAYLSITFTQNTAKKVPIGAFLNVFADSAKHKPLGPTLGEGSLPNRRWLIPGDKVVFAYNHSDDWEVKCTVVAHNGPSSLKAEELPWSIRTETLLAEVLSKCVSVLIRGPPLLPSEAEVSKLLESPLMIKGVQPSYFQPEVIGDADKKFLAEVCSGESPIVAYMEQRVLRGASKQDGVAQAERALVAALLVHTGLSQAAQEVERILFADKNTVPLVSNSLMNLWGCASKLRTSLNLKVQNQMMTAALPESDDALIMEHKNKLYKRAAGSVVAISNILLHALPANAAPANPTEVQLEIMDLINAMDVEQQVVEEVMWSRFVRLLTRKVAFDSLVAIFKDLKHPGIVKKILGSVAGAVQSLRATPDSLPHYLHGVRGCDNNLLNDVVLSFWGLMSHTVSALPTLETFNCLTLKFTPEDLKYISSSNLLEVLFEAAKEGTHGPQAAKVSWILILLLGAASFIDSREVVSTSSSLETPATAPSDTLNELQTHFLTIFQDCLSDSKWLSTSQLYDLLSLAHEISTKGKSTIAVNKHLAEPERLTLMLQTATTGALKTRSIAIRILQSLLPLQKPDVAITMESGSSMPLVDVLFSAVGAEVSEDDTEEMDDDILAPFDTKTMPYKLDIINSVGPIAVAGDGITVSYDKAAGRETKRSNAKVLADKPVPSNNRYYYFEVEVKSGSTHVIGLWPTKEVEGMNDSLPGWDSYSYGYHSDDGKGFEYKLEGSGFNISAPWDKAGSVAGLLWDRKLGILNFTLNGKSQSTPIVNVFGDFYPAIGLKKEGSAVLVNFGQSEFKFKKFSEEVMKIWEEKLVTVQKEFSNLTKSLLNNSSLPWSAAVKAKLLASLASVPKYLDATKEELKEESKAVDGIITTLTILGGDIAQPDFNEEDPAPADTVKLNPHALPLSEIAPYMLPLLDGQDHAGDYFQQFKLMALKALSDMLRLSANSTDDKIYSLGLVNALTNLAVTPVDSKRTTIAKQLKRLAQIKLNQRSGPEHKPKKVKKTKKEKSSEDGLKSPKAEKEPKKKAEKKQNEDGEEEEEEEKPESEEGDEDIIEEDEEDEEGDEDEDEDEDEDDDEDEDGAGGDERPRDPVSEEIMKLCKERDISPAALRGFREAFESFDLDGSGDISFIECMIAISAITGGFGEEDAMEFALMDADGNGTVSEEEFLIYMIKKQPKKNVAGGEAEHSFCCDGCNTEPIVGALYCCMHCGGHYDLCEKCVNDPKVHNPHHLFMKYRNPLPSPDNIHRDILPLTYQLNNIVPVVEPIDFAEDDPKFRKDKDGKYIHDACCNMCGADPIVGIRYKCANRPDYDICEQCEEKEAAEGVNRMYMRMAHPAFGDLFGAKSSVLLPSFYKEQQKLTQVNPGWRMKVSWKDQQRYSVWVEPMDKTVAKEGVVVQITEDPQDDEEVLVALKFEDLPENNNIFWYPLDNLTLVYPEANIKEPARLTQLRSETEEVLAVLYARKSVTTLLGYLPSSFPMPMSTIGGSNLVKLLRCCVLDNLAESTSFDELYNTSKESNELTLLKSKVWSILRQEAVFRSMPGMNKNVDFIRKAAKKWREFTKKKIAARGLQPPSVRPRRTSTTPTPVQTGESNDYSASSNVNTFTYLLVSEAIKNITQTLSENYEYLEEESFHPHSEGEAVSRRLVSLPTAETVLVVFDPKTHLEGGVLTFWKDAALKQPYTRLSGAGPCDFAPVVVPSNEFWLTTFYEETPPKWGYKFWVVPLVPALQDEEVLAKPSFEFGMYIVDWLLSVNPVWVKALYCTEIFDALVGHCNTRAFAVNNRVKIFVALSKLLLQWNLFPSPKPDLSKLDSLESVMFWLYNEERIRNQAVHSIYLNSLIELCLLVRKIKAAENKDEIDTTDLPDWYKSIIEVDKLGRAILAGNPFTSTLIREAFAPEVYSKLGSYIVETNHPYPPNCRGRLNVSFPGVHQIIVRFDPRSKLAHPHAALTFSVNDVVVHKFSESFPIGEDIVIDGDNFVSGFVSNQKGTDWGFSFVAIPVAEPSRMAKEFSVLHAVAENTQDKWNLAMDCRLIAWASSNIKIPKADFMSTATGVHNMFLTMADATKATESDTLLSTVSKEELLARFHLLKFVNEKIAEVLPLVNMKNVGEPWSMAYVFGALRGLLFSSLKTEWFNNALNETASFTKPPRVVLNRRSKEPMVLQAMRQLENKVLRRNDKAFEVVLAGEGSIDAGGPFREAFQIFSEELKSPELAMIIPTPNNRDKTGMGQERNVPNPSPTIYSQAFFEFIGTLMGISIRTGTPLELDLPSIITKPMVGLRTDIEDLKAIDSAAIQYLNNIRVDMVKDGYVNEENFNDYICNNFVTQSTDGREVELKEGGKDLPVTFNNRLEYCDLLEKFRLVEFHKQINAIMTGLYRVIPRSILYVLTSQQLDEKVSGVRTIDLDILRAHTVYRGFSPSDQLIKNFWKVLESFSSEQRQQFLRFAYGRSRLPPDDDFGMPMVLGRFTKGDDPDQFLPESHTCFFQLDLPNYSSYEVLREKLLLAITTCAEIDTDFSPEEEENNPGLDLLRALGLM